MVYEHIRVARTSSSILDLVLTTDLDMINSLVVSDPPIPTDHMAMTFEVVCMVDQVDLNTHDYHFWKGDYETMEANLMNHVEPS